MTNLTSTNATADAADQPVIDAVNSRNKTATTPAESDKPQTEGQPETTTSNTTDVAEGVAEE